MGTRCRLQHAVWTALRSRSSSAFRSQCCLLLPLIPSSTGTPSPQARSADMDVQEEEHQAQPSSDAVTERLWTRWLPPWYCPLPYEAEIAMQR